MRTIDLFGIIILSLALLGVLPGCAKNLASLAETMNARKVQSCLHYQGFGQLGGQLQGQVSGVTATGGVPLETCLGKDAPDRVM